MSKMTGTHGSSSPDTKMGNYQNRDKGTWVERYQKRMGWWKEPTSTQKSVVKHRAAKKRRQRDRQEATS